jgi:hypothetical protein
MPIEDLTFLEEGAFTPIDEVVKAKAQECSTLDRARIFVNSLLSKVKPEEFRRRSASKIISDGYIAQMTERGGGCTDRAIVFAAISRALGFPTKYLETFALDYLREQGEKVQGHVIVEISFGMPPFWHGFDPSKGLVSIKEGRYSNHSGEYVVAGAGLDFSQLYPRTKEGFDASPIAVDTLASIKKLAQRAKELI